ncbi:hypothetical protein [Burkholderia seminalis]|uniref:hypothetical protein n=1 Tax=Burkholderia seminalis TaxID=488731 RepID=UPI002655F16D|nr:hypothetical protein [Burkholderia seminalis]ELK7719024.1 hypothetical protein [Burkholderia cenocepacia]MDN7848123.1 hypothetical protein [Burkholderia seminalis]
MCDPLTAALSIGGTLMSAAGSVQQGNAQRDAANFEAQQQLMQADSTQAMGYQQAKRIREQGQTTTGQATAALAASGVNVGTGTSNDVRQHIEQNTETDALNTILSADNKATSLRQQAAMTAASGQAAQRAGNLGAVGSVLQMGSLAARGGWKRAAQGSTQSS